MATVACPGCGLPRVEAEVGEKPCPVCSALPVESAGGNTPLTRQPEADPLAGLPADVSELYSAPAPASVRTQAGPGDQRSRAVLVGAVAFVLGILCGVGGVLGFQSLAGASPRAEGVRIAAKPRGESPLLPAGERPNGVPTESPPTPGTPAVAPMPREASAKTVTIDSRHDFVLPELPPPGVVVTYNINLPDGVHNVSNMKKGEHIVLKGKVHTLRVHALTNGAVLDASQLQASGGTVTGRITDGSVLKVNAPAGAVHVSQKIDGRSAVELNAPGGEVTFTTTTTSSREGSKIDGGSKVSVTARAVELKGDIAGSDTRVSVTLTEGAWMKFTAVTGKAVLEYKSQAAGRPEPEIVMGSVARTATFRKME